MSELWGRTAIELAGLIASGEASSREVVEAHLARIDEVNPKLNAVVHRLDESALAAADAADAAVGAGDALGPLHGVPITVKENIDLVGSATTQGVVAMADALPPENAPVTERMLAAGAIPIGRTNLPDFGLRIHTDSSLRGLTRNPNHHDRTAGGSSGGEGAAIASGMSPLGLGNDIGGSLRNPAHCCGIASIKPSTGVVPSASSLPPEDPTLAFQQMAVQGPMARGVASVRRALDVLAGPHRRDPVALPVELTDLAEGERLRIAVLAEPPGGETDPEIAAAVRSAADTLADAGHEIVEATPPHYEETIDWWTALLVQDTTVMRPLLDGVMGPDAQQVLGSLIDGAPEITLEMSVMVQGGRHQAMREWLGFFAEHHAVLSPTWALPAFEHGADLDPDPTAAESLIRNTLRPVIPPNFLGLPAAVVPHGVADGLPVGVQVIGERFSDLRCLAIAAQIEEATGIPDPVTPTW